MLKKFKHFIPPNPLNLYRRYSTVYNQNITASSPDPVTLQLPYWTIKPHPVAHADPFRATGTLWLISKNRKSLTEIRNRPHETS